jgi:hypothetical protein
MTLRKKDGRIFAQCDSRNVWNTERLSESLPPSPFRRGDRLAVAAVVLNSCRKREGRVKTLRRPATSKSTWAVGILTLNLLFMRAPSLLAQSPPKPAKEVLQEYRKMDASGERLADSGWYRASAFFVKPEPPPRSKVFAVIESEILNSVRVTGDLAEISLRCLAIGQVDSVGRFTSTIAPSLDQAEGHLAQPGSPQMIGPAALERVYDLVLADTHWEIGPGLEPARAVKGTPEWRIETFEREPWVSAEAAIGYLTRLRKESRIDAVRANADRSIAILRKARAGKKP